jgi:hypothetical protein
MGRVHHSMAALNRTCLKHLRWASMKRWRGCLVANVCAPLGASSTGPGQTLAGASRWRSQRNRREPSLPERKGVPNGVARLSLEVPAYRARKLGGTEPGHRQHPAFPAPMVQAQTPVLRLIRKCAKTWKMVRKPARRMRFALGKLFACSRGRYASVLSEKYVCKVAEPCRGSDRHPRSIRKVWDSGFACPNS